MRLSNQQIQTFQELYEKRFGIHLSAEEARNRGNKLVELIKAVYAPIETMNMKMKNDKKIRLHKNQ